MFHDFTFGYSAKSLLSLTEKQLVVEISPDKPVFINCMESSVRELLAHQIASEHLYRTGKRALWLRLEKDPPFFLPEERDNIADVCNLWGEDWSGKLTRLFIEYGKSEETYSCLILDSLCGAETYSSNSTAKQASRRMDKISNALKRLRKYLCNMGVHLIVLGHVDEELKNANTVASLTKREFNDIKSLFGFVLTLSDLKFPDQEMEFSSGAGGGERPWLGHVSVRAYNPIGQPVAGLEESFSVTMMDEPVVEERKAAATSAA